MVALGRVPSLKPLIGGVGPGDLALAPTVAVGLDQNLDRIAMSKLGTADEEPFDDHNRSGLDGAGVPAQFTSCPLIGVIGRHHPDREGGQRFGIHASPVVVSIGSLGGSKGGPIRFGHDPVEAIASHNRGSELGRQNVGDRRLACRAVPVNTDQHGTVWPLAKRATDRCFRSVQVHGADGSRRHRPESAGKGSVVEAGGEFKHLGPPPPSGVAAGCPRSGRRPRAEGPVGNPAALPLGMPFHADADQGLIGINTDSPTEMLLATPDGRLVLRAIRERWHWNPDDPLAVAPPTRPDCGEGQAHLVLAAVGRG